jgi:hypothetical protein
LEKGRAKQIKVTTWWEKEIGKQKQNKIEKNNFKKKANIHMYIFQISSLLWRGVGFL